MSQPPFTELSAQECWELLAADSFGRLVTAAAGELDIVPINYVVDERTIVFRTAAGTKLAELTVSPRVAFEIDRVGPEIAESVVVKGSAHRVESGREIDALEALPLRPLVPTVKDEFVRIVPDTLTGRRFFLGPEPERSFV